MKPAAFISSRLRFRAALPVAAVALSFLVMIIAGAVSDGFRREIHRGIASFSGDIQLTAKGGDVLNGADPLTADSAEVAAILALPQVESVQEAVYRAGIIRHEGTIQGVIVKGIPDSGLGQLDISVPSWLSERLGIGEGDDMTTYFVGEEQVRVRKFHVARLHESILTSDDYPTVFARVEDLRRLNGWTGSESSALEVMLGDGHHDAAHIDEAAWDVASCTRLVAMPLTRKYPQLFGWLELLDLNVLLILLLMTLVAGFNMISGLLIMLFRHVGTIGTLKSMGMGDGAIAGVFLRVASRITLVGMAIGNALALLFCVIQGTAHLIRLNPVNYFVSFVPVAVNLPRVLLTDVAAYVLIMLLMLIPTLFIARVDPAKTVRAE